jgi:hypothetical protein
MISNKNCVFLNPCDINAKPFWFFYFLNKLSCRRSWVINGYMHAYLYKTVDNFSKKRLIISSLPFVSCCWSIILFHTPTSGLTCFIFIARQTTATTRRVCVYSKVISIFQKDTLLANVNIAFFKTNHLYPTHHHHYTYCNNTFCV